MPTPAPAAVADDDLRSLVSAVRASVAVHERSVQAQEQLCREVRQLSTAMLREHKKGRIAEGIAPPTPTQGTQGAASGFQNLTDDNVQGIRQVFDAFDADNSGSLSKTECIQLVQRLGIISDGGHEGGRRDNASKHNVRDAAIRMITEIDANNDGTIDWPEMVQYMDRVASTQEMDFSETSKRNIKVGYGGTTWRKSGNILWLSHHCLIICAAAVVVVGAVYHHPHDMITAIGKPVPL
jgi:hypothetical protein